MGWKHPLFTKVYICLQKFTKGLNMKKFLLFISVLLVTAVCVHAIAPAAPSVAANKYLVTYLTKKAGFDTLAGVDSTVIANKIAIKAGSAYVLTHGPITGDSDDSVKIQMVADVYDFNKNFVRRVAIDSLTDSAGGDIAIPFFDTIFGAYFTIKWIGYTGNGGKVILPSVAIYARKLYIEQKTTVGDL